MARPQPSDEASRYVVGIDLGTTNSAVAYVDTQQESWSVETLSVPQLVAPGEVDARETIPSFHHQPATGELNANALRLPWSKEDPAYAVGVFARDHGSLVPGRLIASAKSWLCHTGVDRTARLLPWHGAADVDRLSPVEVSSRYLAHMRDAWDAKFKKFPLAEQDLVLTLPASFDEVARELTVEAAALAGLKRVVLIEEPQAAFYAWIHTHSGQWDQLVEPGQKILVCDVGGGTSDFTLIRVRRGDEDRVQFHRVAVGDHLILGGDNFDLALANFLEQRVCNGGKLEPRQFDVLVRSCRNVKETMLGPQAPEKLTVNLPGSGAKLIGGGLQIEVTRDEVRQQLVEGFFPRVKLDHKPLARQSGFQEFGLPYASDPAVTKYLAAFLTAHRDVALDDLPQSADHDPARPDVVLFNGGVFAGEALRQRLLETISSWFQTANEPEWQPLVLSGDRLDLAVARGAAYYGMVRRGQGVRIAANLARTYYVGVESATPSALCLVPAQTEPGNDVELTGRTFNLLISEPVEFPLFSSSTRLTDAAGELVPIDREQMTPLAPIRTVLKTRGKGEQGSVPVHLHASLTEIGTVELACHEAGGPRKWRLQFDVRSATQTDVGVHEGTAELQGFLDEGTWDACRDELLATFGPDGTQKPEGLVKRITAAIELNRWEWPPSLLRRIWETLMECAAARRRSQQHEARWLNLLGFSLRPGYGLAMDDWRVAETWRHVQGKMYHSTPNCRTEWWILWRRVAGGLERGQQNAIAEPLLGPVRALHRRSTGQAKKGEFSFGPQEATEVWRLLGSLELLDVPVKIELGNMLVDLAPKRKLEPFRPAIVWALGRVGARVPVYGPLNSVVPVEVAGKWLNVLLDLATADGDALAVMQLARRTEDRYRDLPDKLRERALGWLEQNSAAGHLIHLVRDGGRLDAEEQQKVMGEALPKGLQIW